MKTLTLAGLDVEFSAPESDVYLQTMSAHGPVDLQPVFEAFCLPGATVVDVGANIGVTAVMAAQLVGDGAVVAIEPVPETYRHLQANIGRAGLTNVACVPAAAAAESGEVHLVTQPGSNVAAFVGYEHALDRYAGYHEELAEARTLDDIVASQQLQRLDFLKIDVEGYELEVLRGARETLARFHPVVFLEANHYCLNIFRKTSLVDFVEEVLGQFPAVYAVDLSFQLLDLQDPSTHHIFFHDNVVLGRFPNLLCGQDAEVAERLVARIPR